MAIGQHLSQIQTQKLILSPQIRQFLRLLQLPSLEIQEAIDQELAQNPAIEEVAPEDSGPEQETEPPSSADPGSGPDENSLSPQELDFQRRLDDLEKLDEIYRGAGSVRSDTTHEHMDDLEKRLAYRESLITKSTTLADHLNWQSKLQKFSDLEQRVLAYIIGNINDEGYLTVTIEEIAEAFAITPEEANRMLALAQQFDPPGVAARNLAECLCLQLRRLDKDTSLAEAVVGEHLSLLERRKFTLLARALGVSEGQVREAVKLIAQLEPKPGRAFYRDEPIDIVPDVRVIRDDLTGKYVAELIDDSFPRLRISPQYRKMLRDKSLDKKAKEYLRERIHSGLWFMNAIVQRKTTLQRIADRIVDIQAEFMEHGPGRLKPLRMKDIAAQIGVHESTVSRAIQAKYMSTPHSTVPMRSFFSTSLATEDGGSESQTSIMEKIKRLVEEENPSKPLSDQKLVALLKAQGVKVARRTVAKYREMLRILPSHLRRKETAA